jgi:CDP-diacylglycerol---serine O-phosphatidyltransferase
VVTVLAGVLMVLNVRYYSFKDIDFHNPVPFVSILAFVLILVVVAWHTATVLFILAILYAFSGPLMAIYLRRKKKPVLLQPVETTVKESDVGH